MTRIAVLAGATVGGYLGWLAGQPFGTMTAFLLGIVGTAAGTYLGRRWASQYR